MTSSMRLHFAWKHMAAIAAAACCFASTVIQAKPQYRQAFFAVYPNAIGSPIETVPSQPTHCGACHWKFTGGGARNPFGVRVETALGQYPNNDQGYRDAIWSIRNLDSDADGFTTLVEVTDEFNYTNTPTFPGLTPANVNSVTQVSIAEIQDYLVPSSSVDTTPPTVTVLAPNGGQVLVANSGTTVQWSATDASGISGISLYVSLDAGASYSLVASGISNSGSYLWFPANRPTTTALFMVEAVDNAFNYGTDVSNSVFTIQSPPGGTVPTTLRDFDMPGTQPFDAGVLNPPEACAVCHGNYNSAVEPYFNWQGSMMAQASIDPLFEAAMVIANQDAPDSGDLCLRCHLSRGWMQGRSVPTDGSAMLESDLVGLTCDFCHRMVDPIPSVSNPIEDTDILAALSQVPLVFGTGMYVIDPTGARRGPFADADSGHPILVSPFHREAALCGTCHDVSNPAFQKDGQGNYVPNAFNTPASNFSANVIAPVERTFSEWLNSQYNTMEGVYAPEFAGNKAGGIVHTCQDCHMRDVTGRGCNANPPLRNDLPLHDMTGGSTWLPGLLSTLYPALVNPAAMQAGIDRARYMLQNAADLTVEQEEVDLLRVTVTNNTGHKLPTGYPEGRRMWINVQFYDAGENLISQSGAYDLASGDLSHDAEAKIYEIEPTTSGIPGVPDGTLFHFVLNNEVLKDNRIPPRGFTNAAFAAFGGPPVAYSYADGQFWDHSHYAVPSGAVSATVNLYYQSTSKEFITFLRDANFTNTIGQELYDLWANNGKCPPELMQSMTIPLAQCLSSADCDDGLYCNGAEVCNTSAGACESGPAPCGSCEQCDEQTDSCHWCTVDMDQSGAIGTGDFAMFTSCFGGCYATFDECWEANFDLSSDGCVSTSDFALFSNCFGGPCAACELCQGP